MPKISERTLKSWRTDALKEIELMKEGAISSAMIKNQKRILDLTQILLDQYLLEKK